MPSLISGAVREMEFRQDYKDVIKEFGKGSKEHDKVLKKYNAEIDFYSKIKKHEVYLPSMKLDGCETQSVMFFLEDKPRSWGKG